MARPRADKNITVDNLTKQITTILLDAKNIKDFKLSITKLSHVERCRLYMNFFKIVIDSDKKKKEADEKISDAILLLTKLNKGVE